MKLKIYQQGGGLIYTPFIPERTSSTISGSSNNDSNEPKIDPLDKEILGLMKDSNLLPSDIQSITSALTAFQKRTQRLSSIGGTDAYRSVMPGMLQIMNMVSIAKHNREYWTDKVTEMRNHDAGSDVALDSYGRMWVQSADGKLDRISPDKFDKEKYIPISNSQLLYLRQREYGFGDSLIDDTGMSLTGMGDVREEMDSIIKNFGTIKTDNLELKKFSEIAKDLQGFGIYKITSKYSKADLQDFSGLLYNRLSTNAKHLINANCAITGSDPHNYIFNIIQSETSREVTQDFDASLSKAANGGGSGSGSGDQLTHDTYAEHLNIGNAFNPPTWMVIQPSNSDLALYAYSQDVGPVLKDEKRFETASLAEVLSNADAIGSIVDANNICFGDQLLNVTDFSKVMYDGSSNMKRVELPVKTDVSGHIKPDFDAQQKVGKLQEFLDKHGEVVYSLIKEKLEDVPNAYLDEEHGVIRFKNSKPFLAINGVVSSDKVRIDTNSNYIRSMDKGEGNIRKDYKDIYNNVIETGYLSGDKKRYDNGKAAGRHLYEGVIYMPLIGPNTASGIYNQEWFSKNTYTDTTQTSEARQKRLNGQFNFDE